ncbi:MAG: hypothetical protein HZB26_17675 [Candidatus Hydrogenedentes bacterium]|nr:hypothetical protein [Candidatus Hydrogenedentota bacterium]
MKPLALALVVTCALVACAPRQQNEAPAQPKAVTPNAPASRPGGTPVIKTALNYNIGDVEQCVHLQMTLADESKAANVEVKELTRSNKLINSSTITVSPPFPEHLWVRLFVVLDNKGPEAPVVLRGSVALGEKGEKVIQPFKCVSFLRNEIAETKIDIMPHLEGTPESVFVGIKADALLLPAGTDAASVNPDTATASPENMSVLFSNPFVVKFNRAPEAK